jgi:hypothetical protein
MGHGFMHPLIADVVDAWFAAAKTERIVAGEEAVEITRVRIPDAGRRALAEPRDRSGLGRVSGAWPILSGQRERYRAYGLFKVDWRSKERTRYGWSAR